MIDVNSLIQNVCRGLNIVGDTQTANGTKAQIALDYLNSVIADLNSEEYIADNIKVYFVSASKTITIGEHEDCDINFKAPSCIKHLGRKIGERYTRLNKSNLEGIFGTKSNGLPSLFNYRVEYDPEKDCMVGKITMNGSARSDFVVTFIAPIDTVEITSVLYLQDIYKNALEAGLSVLLAKHYKMLDLVKMYEDDFDTAKDKLKTINTNNRPLIWDDTIGSYLDSYYNGLYGEGL